MIAVSQKLLDQAEAYAIKAAPYESCGLLFGCGDDITELRISDNVTTGDPRKSFEIDPALLISAQREARQKDIELMGVWHSHPDGQPQLSDRDRKRSVYKSWYWLITATGRHAGHALYKTAEDPKDLRLIDYEIS